MVDPRSDIRSKPGSSGWHLALERANRDGGSTYLGDPEVVDGLLRAFAFDIVTRQGLVAKGTLPQPQAIEQDKKRARELAGIFAGDDQAYVTVGDWNPAGLVEWIKRAMPDRIDEKASATETLNGCFALFIAEVYESIQMAIDGQPDDVWQGKADGAIEDWRNLLLGIPNEEA